MKKLAILIFGLFLLNSCKKEAQTQTETSTPNSKEVSLVQDAVKLKNDKGEEISVTYFAEGSEVAVKLQKTGAKEEKLSAKTTSSNGNPIFTNEEWMWEMTQEGKGGRLTDKSGNSSEYR